MAVRRTDSGALRLDDINGACVLARRELIEQVGLMDERYFLHREEIDGTRMRAHGAYRPAFGPDAVVYHRVGAIGSDDYGLPSLAATDRLPHGRCRHLRHCQLLRRRLVRAVPILRGAFGSAAA